MSDFYMPTMHTKWFRIGAGNTETVCVVIKGVDDLPDEKWCLKQLWTSAMQGEPDEWRDVEQETKRCNV